MDASELKPLTTTARSRLAKGRVLPVARFETGPVLGALAGISLALATYGLLRWHWRKEGWDHPEPERPVRESRMVLGLGVLGCAVYIPRLIFDANRDSRLGPFFPVAGGLMLLFSINAFSFAVLETQRRGRRLMKERGLIAGALLVLMPLCAEFIRYVINFQR